MRALTLAAAVLLLASSAAAQDACAVANCAACFSAGPETCDDCENGFNLDNNACTACATADCAVCDADPGTCDG